MKRILHILHTVLAAVSLMVIHICPATGCSWRNSIVSADSAGNARTSLSGGSITDPTTPANPNFDTNGVPDPEYKKYPLPPDVSSVMDYPVVGLSVNAGVTPLGAATFTVPIEIPPGVGLAVPELSVSYSSLSGNGLLGLGCTLQGMSVITRSAKDVFHDNIASGISYGETCALRLDGKRLVPKGSGIISDGSVYVPEDDPFTEITVRGSGTDVWFEVHTRDGRTVSYGSTPDSRQLLTTPSGTSFVNTWCISSVEDANGNFSTYSYSRDDNFLYPRCISYGGNTHTTAGARNTVTFAYTTRDDKMPFTVNGISGSVSKILSSIESKTGETQYRHITFRYGKDQGCGASLLHGITVRLDATYKQKSVDIRWNETQWFSPTAEIAKISEVASLFTEKKNRRYLSGDFNGDGISDIFEFSEAGYYTGTTKHISSLCQPYVSRVQDDGSVRFTATAAMSIDTGFSFDKWKKDAGYPFLSDLDGDGFQDLVIPYYTGTPDKNSITYTVYRGNSEGTLKNHVSGVSVELVNSANMPLHANADFDGDGRKELLVVEPTTGSAGVNVCQLIPYADDGEGITPRQFSVAFNFVPQQLFTADFNGDGMTDFMVVHSAGCYTYLNKGNGNPYFGFVSPVADLNVHTSDLTDIGDFNGDGIPDFVLFSDGKLTVAIGNGDGHFTQCTAQEISGLTRSDFNADLAQTVVYDFDRDGKSDIVMGKADKNGGNIYWLRSTGASFQLKRHIATPGKEDNSAGRLAVGDFNGDGLAELLNYGGDCWNGGNEEGASLRIYPDKCGAQAFKVSTITDSFGNTARFGYKSLSTGGVYTKANGASFPVQDVAASYGVVSVLTRSNGAAGENTTAFSYGGLKCHLQGKGVMGMTTFSASNEMLGTSRLYIQEWDTVNFIPSYTKETSRTGDGVSTAETFNKTVSCGGSIFTCPERVMTTDADGNVTAETRETDTAHGYITRDRVVYADGSYSETEYSNYVNRNGKWLPQEVTTRRKHSDDNSDYTDKTAYTYDASGNVYTETVHKGTPKELTTIYVQRNYFGNALSVMKEGEGVCSILSVNEYDPTGRFVVRVYTDPATVSHSYKYDTFGRLTEEIDDSDPDNPLTAKHGYNCWGQETRTTSPEGVTVKTWHGWGNTPSKRYYRLIYSLGRPWIKTWYDACGREVATETAIDGNLLSATETAYDNKGQKIQAAVKTGKLQQTISMAYDSRGRLASEETSGGRKTEYTYGNRSVTASDGIRNVVRTYDAWGNLHTVDDGATVLEYRYSSCGKPSSVTCGGNTMKMEYDEAGNRVLLDDPDAGTVRCRYDAEGKPLEREDGREAKTEYRYDEKGRLEARTGADGDITYTYDKRGDIASEEHDGNTVTYIRDKYGRTKTELRYFKDGTAQIHSYAYDKYGNMVAETLPNGLTVNYAYDEYGNNTSVILRGDTVWTRGTDDGLERRNSLFGGKMTHFRRIDRNGMLSELRLEKGANKRFRRMRYEYDAKTGNMTYRDGMRSKGSDSFKYDTSDRLVSYTRRTIEKLDSTAFSAPSSTQSVLGPGILGPGIGGDIITGSKTDSYVYSADGNIQAFPVAGRYTYSAARPHAVESVSDPEGKMSQAAQNISYNAIGKAETVSKTVGGEEYRLDLSYGPDDSRWMTTLAKGDRTPLTAYFGDCYEETEEDGTVRSYAYLGNGLLYYEENNSGRLMYMFTDALGSVTDIYTAEGENLFHAEYDPWGNMTVTRNGIGFMRGYTGHEMLPDFGLVNMGGRLYDPCIGRFLSPDRYVQMPDNSQNFNRYSYCLNNPLKYTDPSGNLFGIDDFFIAMTLFNVGSSMIQAKATGGNIWKAGAASLFGSVATYGIGAAFGSAGSFGHEMLRAGAHGVSGSFSSILNGGSFCYGFLSGALSSGIGSYASSIGMSADAMIGSMTLAGGLSSLAGGGDFLGGALHGMQIGLLNHVMHDDFEMTHDSYGNMVGYIPEVVIERQRPLVWHVLETSGTIYTIGGRLYKTVRIGSNNKLYYNIPDGKAFYGNQYVKTSKIKSFAGYELSGRALEIVLESPQVVYALNNYGYDSQEFKRAFTVAAGRIVGGECGSKIFSRILGSAAYEVAAYFSMGSLSVPAYIVGDITGNIVGGWLGADFGGAIGGVIFDLTY